REVVPPAGFRDESNHALDGIPARRFVDRSRNVSQRREKPRRPPTIHIASADDSHGIHTNACRTNLGRTSDLPRTHVEATPRRFPNGGASVGRLSHFTTASAPLYLREVTHMSSDCDRIDVPLRRAYDRLSVREHSPAG